MFGIWSRVGQSPLRHLEDDDILIGGRTTADIESTVALIENKWAIKRIGPQTDILRTRIHYDPSAGILTMDRKREIATLALTFGITPNAKITNPMMESFSFDPDTTPFKSNPDMNYNEAVTYMRSIIGTYLHLAISVRPDIMYAVAVLARYVTYPHPKIIAAAKRIGQYLINTENYAIKFEKDERTTDRFIGFSDAGYQREDAEDKVVPKDQMNPEDETVSKYEKETEVNENTKYLLETDDETDSEHEEEVESEGKLTKEKRSSICNIVYKHGPIIWRSTRSPWVCDSIAKAEMTAMYKLLTDMAFLNKVYHFLKKGVDLEEFIPTNDLALTDSRTVVKQVRTLKLDGKLVRHWENKLHYCLEKFKKGIAYIMHIPTKNNPSDIGTKPLGLETFTDHAGRLFDFSKVDTHPLDNFIADYPDYNLQKRTGGVGEHLCDSPVV